MNRPITTDGTPVMISDRKRTSDASRRCLPYSLRYTAASTPSGTDSSVATAVIASVPTIAGAMPPPAAVVTNGMSFVKKPPLNPLRPARTT